MQRKAMIPLIVFDVVVNVYLTSLFLLPVLSKALPFLDVYKHRLMKDLELSSTEFGIKSPIRKIALTTFIGSCATLFSSIA